MLSYRCGQIDEPHLPLERIAALGVTHLEIQVPDEPDIDAIGKQVEAAGLGVGSVHAVCTLEDADVLEKFEHYARVAEGVGAGILFASLHTGELSLTEAHDRLRRCGDTVAPFGVKIGMETHRDLCHNGELAARTMEAVAHPNVGINFDTANIYYYNKGTDSVAELRKTAPYVVSVHLKDTDGGFESNQFPPFGQGVVDFAGVVAVLDEVGFAGPLTMEVEGAFVRDDDIAVREQFVADSIAHLKDVGIV